MVLNILRKLNLVPFIFFFHFVALLSCSNTTKIKEDKNKNSENQLVDPDDENKDNSVINIFDSLYWEIETDKSKRISKKLETYYQNKDTTGLRLFIENWYNESSATFNYNSISNLHKKIYTVFAEFYRLVLINKIKKQNINTLLNELDFKEYVVFPNTMTFMLYNSENDTIRNFRPYLLDKRFKILYLYYDYEVGIMKFIKVKESERCDPYGYHPRLDFLNIYLSIKEGLSSFIPNDPEIKDFRFNEKLDTVGLRFRILTVESYVELVYSKTKWNFVPSDKIIMCSIE
jgi:hypothetical protein